MQPLLELHAQLVAAEALPSFIGPKLGKMAGAGGAQVDVEVTFETAPSVLWDAVAVPSGDQALAELGHAKEFLKDQFRHCKPILLMAAKSALAQAIALPETLLDGSKDPGIAMDASGFISALGLHQAFEREVDPLRI